MSMFFEWNDAYGQELIDFVQKSVQTRSYSDEEGKFAHLIEAKMEELGFDEVYIDPAGNVVGRVGNGPKVIHFDSHMDTVQVNDADEWVSPPFGGEIVDGVVTDRNGIVVDGVIRQAVAEKGLLGVFTGGFTAAAGGICAAVFFGLIVALLFKPGDKNK